MKKLFWLVFAVVLVTSVTRLWYLGKIPSSMSDDEVRLVSSAYSIWHTGKDISGNSFPMAFLIDGYAFNPVAIYLTSPFVGILDLNMFSARLPFALAGIISVVLVFTLAYQLLRNKFIAFLSAITLTFSAWHLQLSRFSYEGTIALMFYLLAINIFLKIKKNSIISTILSMLTFFIAFYSYSGTKLIFLPVILILIWYKYKNLNYKQLSIIIGFVIFIFSSFLILSKYAGASSYGEKQFFFQNTSSLVAEKVELERRGSSAPEIFKKIFHNKLTYLSRIFVEQYTYAFSPQYLFTSQEGSGIFSIWGRGQLYYMEALLILLGMIYICFKKRREFFLIFMFLLIAPLPSALGSDPITYTIRSSFMLPWLFIFIGAGIFSISFFIANIKIKSLVYLLLTILYIYSIIGYFNQYYYEWDTYGSKYYSKKDKDLAQLLQEEKKNKQTILVASSGFMNYLHYAFYNKVSPNVVRAGLNRNPIKIDNIIFEKKCPELVKKDPRTLVPKNSLYIVPFQCPKTKTGEEYAWKPNRIIKSPDLETEWLVYSN